MPRTRQRTRQNIREEVGLVSRTRIRQAQKSLLRQSQVLRTKQAQRNISSIPIISVPIKITRIPIIAPFFSLKGIIGKRERKYKGYEDIALASDLASQVLKLKPMAISEKKLMKIAGEPFGVRRPYYISRKKTRRKKRR